MSFVAAATIGAGLLGAGASIYGSNKMAKSGQAALAVQTDMFDQLRRMARPYINTGTEALGTLKGLITPGPNMTATLSQIPGFQFLQDWGQRSVENLYSGRGLGGNARRAGIDYATGVANQSFFPLVQSLQGLVNTGTGALSALGGQALGFGGNIGSALTGIGQAQAAGITGAAGGISNAFQNLGNMALLNKLTNGAIFGGNNGMYGNPNGPYGTNPFTPSGAVNTGYYGG